MQDACYLVLDDGQVLPGEPCGYPAPYAHELVPGNVLAKGAGEVVFNTGMTGYPEILTDPSYTGQIVVMTYPHIGNYGVSDDWSEVGPESGKGHPQIKAAAFVMRSLYRGPVPAGRVSLDEHLRNHMTPGIANVDTRGLTLRIRDGGSPQGVIVRPANTERAGLSDEELQACLRYLEAFPTMVGRNLIGEVGTREPVAVSEGAPHVVLVDYGIKANIVREVQAAGARVTVLPSSATEEDILAQQPDGILFGNGPGDPAVLEAQVEVIRKLIGQKPLFGICLGHQLLAEALGGTTFKMKFGHHGVNHPVRDEYTKKVFVTSQNHGFSVKEESLPSDVEIWFRNANDRTVEGLRHTKLPILSAQFHPEAAPGPHDATWIFRRFLEAIPEAS